MNKIFLFFSFTHGNGGGMDETILFFFITPPFHYLITMLIILLFPPMMHQHNMSMTCLAHHPWSTILVMAGHY